MKLLLPTMLLSALFMTAGCDRGMLTGPPTLRLGRDECRECGMAIHDERSASALLVDREGRRDYLVFDDIGCMLDIERDRGTKLGVIDRFVHDHANNRWVSADAATFLFTDGSTLHTPMGSGIAGFADRSSAEAGRQQFGGEVVDYRALAAKRRSQYEERHSAPGG